MLKRTVSLISLTLFTSFTRAELLGFELTNVRLNTDASVNSSGLTVRSEIDNQRIRWQSSDAPIVTSYQQSGSVNAGNEIIKPDGPVLCPGGCAPDLFDGLAQNIGGARAHSSYLSNGNSVSIYSELGAYRLPVDVEDSVHDGDDVEYAYDYNFNTGAKKTVAVRSRSAVSSSMTLENISEEEPVDFLFYARFDPQGTNGYQNRLEGSPKHRLSLSANIDTVERNGESLIERPITRFDTESPYNWRVPFSTNERATYQLSGTIDDSITISHGLYAELLEIYDNDWLNEQQLTAKDSFTANLFIGAGSSQFNPIMPDSADNETGTYQFSGARSGGWYDPIAFENYLFTMDTANSFFTDILSFPTGFGEEFGLYAIDNMDNLLDLDDWLYTDNVDFVSLLGGLGAKQFLVTGINAIDDTHQFPIQLAFSNELVDFTMQGIDDVSAFLNLYAQQSELEPVSTPGTLALLTAGLMLCFHKRRQK